MLELARFLCLWHFFRGLTYEEASRPIKDAIMTVAA
jgi:hypothetical protein